MHPGSPAWQAFRQAYENELNHSQQAKWATFEVAFQQFKNNNTIGNQLGQLGGIPRWTSVDEMMADLAARKATIPNASKPVDKATRIQQIEDELDILRGVKPTPKGYVADNNKTKSLMKELRELKSDPA